MITKEQYEAAKAAKEAAEKTINEYFTQKANDFAARHARYEAGQEFYTDADLVYSAGARCPCGHGLAYPKDCGPNHHWDCSAILKGTADQSVKHEGKLPFAFYSIIEEIQVQRARGQTTRPKPPLSEIIS